MEKAQELSERVVAMPPIGVRLNKLSIDGVREAMGLNVTNLYRDAVGSITNLLSSEAEAPDGRRLQDIIEQEGLREFLKARNEFFDRPWP